MTISPIRAVLFDAAGTLIHVREPVGVTYARLAASYGVLVAAERISSAFRRVLRAMPPMVYPDASGADLIARERGWWSTVVREAIAGAAPDARFADFPAYFGAVFRYYADAAAWIVTPDAHTTLAALRQRDLRTGVVSNFDHRLPRLLVDLGLAPLLDVVIRPADAGAAKPDPRIFRTALARLDIPPHQALYVGDDAEEDIRGARNAGLTAVDVTTLATLQDVLACVR